MSIMDNVQPAVKKETGKVAAITGIGLILYVDRVWSAACFHATEGTV